jgi:hypothetical protein
MMTEMRDGEVGKEIKGLFDIGGVKRCDRSTFRIGAESFNVHIEHHARFKLQPRFIQSYRSGTTFDSSRGFGYISN